MSETDWFADRKYIIHCIYFKENITTKTTIYLKNSNENNRPGILTVPSTARPDYVDVF